MNEQEIITLLDYYGHLRMPFGDKVAIGPLTGLTLESPAVRDAIQSYQSMHLLTLEAINHKFWPTSNKPVSANGDLTDSTLTLLETARCSTPDYQADLPEEAGSGSWAGCHGIGNFHAATVRFTNAPPSFLAPVFDQVWNRVVDAYSELGLEFIRDDSTNSPNILVSFVVPDGGWIGLAIVGAGQSCSSQIWAKFDQRYKPTNIISEWTTLLKHELGHNCGLQHSSGGVMNPYIMPGLPVTWKGDVSFPLLAARFGGVAVPSATPKQRDLVLAIRTGDQFEVLQVVDTSNGFQWPK